MSDTYRIENNILVGKCPHCQEYVSIKEKDIQCGIFRHAVYRNNYQPIPPHSSKIECETLVSTNKVFGCAKPFQVRPCPLDITGEYQIVACDYL
jgi:hypothetical protein